MFKLSLSPGHGIGTPGKCTPDGMHEWEFNSSVVSKMVELFSHYTDTTVLRLDDPTGKRDIPLQERAKRSNDWGADYHLDVHANAYGSGWNDSRGIETFSYKLSGTSFEIGKKLQAALISATELSNRGVKDASENGAGYYMICKTKAPANLVECGFMTNKNEATLLKSDAYRTKVANALVGAIADHFTKKPTVKAAESNAALWDGMELKKGQCGRITILKPINLWKRIESRLETVRVLQPGEVYRVYGYDEQHGGQYGVGAGLWVTNMDGYIKYETPSKDLLDKVK
jgi:N-acetylmuramoyl-L-alanine amidase